jgi:hypothetical protein
MAREQPINVSSVLHSARLRSALLSQSLINQISFSASIGCKFKLCILAPLHPKSLFFASPGRSWTLKLEARAKAKAIAAATTAEERSQLPAQSTDLSTQACRPSSSPHALLLTALSDPPPNLLVSSPSACTPPYNPQSHHPVCPARTAPITPCQNSTPEQLRHGAGALPEAAEEALAEAVRDLPHLDPQMAHQRTRYNSRSPSRTRANLAT